MMHEHQRPVALEGAHRVMDIKALGGVDNNDPTAHPVSIQLNSNALESHRERDDNYQRMVVALNPTWRVIECKDGIQWIVQRRNGTRHGQPQWEGRKYCRSRGSLIHACRAAAGEVDPIAMAVLAQLPDWVEARS